MEANKLSDAGADAAALLDALKSIRAQQLRVGEALRATARELRLQRRKMHRPFRRKIVDRLLRGPRLARLMNVSGVARTLLRGSAERALAFRPLPIVPMTGRFGVRSAR